VKKLNGLFYICLLIVLSGCFLSGKKTIKSRADLIAYVNDPENGIQKKDSVGKIEAVLTYRPWQMAAFNALKFNNKDTMPKPAFADDKLSFVLSLSANHKELLRQLKFNQYSQMVQVMAFRMKEFIKAVPDNGEAVEPLDCLFQQTYGMGTANNLLIVFDRQKLMKANSLRVRIRDFGLNTGDMNFEMNIKDIKNIPIAGIK
jgi:hypothetical protein